MAYSAHRDSCGDRCVFRSRVVRGCLCVLERSGDAELDRQGRGQIRLAERIVQSGSHHYEIALKIFPYYFCIFLVSPQHVIIPT